LAGRTKLTHSQNLPKSFPAPTHWLTDEKKKRMVTIYKKHRAVSGKFKRNSFNQILSQT